jgi:hypothetical protein
MTTQHWYDGRKTTVFHMEQNICQQMLVESTNAKSYIPNIGELK